MHPSKVTLRAKVRRPMAWDSTKNAPGAQQPRGSHACARRQACPIERSRALVPRIVLLLKRAAPLLLFARGDVLQIGLPPNHVRRDDRDEGFVATRRGEDSWLLIASDDGRGEIALPIFDSHLHAY